MSGFWIFLVICGIIISFAQKNQAQQRRTTSSDGPDTTPHADPEKELKRELREIFGEYPPQKGDTTTSQHTVPTSTQTPSAALASKPKPSHKPVAKQTQQKASTPPTKGSNTPQQGTQAPADPANSNIKDIIDDFSTDKAVIYSEILKPKWEEF